MYLPMLEDKIRVKLKFHCFSSLVTGLKFALFFLAINCENRNNT